MLCSKHFEDNCFEQDRKLSDSIGFGKRQACLNSEALPTILQKAFLKRKSLISQTPPFTTHIACTCCHSCALTTFVPAQNEFNLGNSSSFTFPIILP